MIDFTDTLPDSFSGCVSVSRPGAVLYEVPFGYAKLADRIENTVLTRFATASAGKAFVAAGVMTLIGRGMLMPDTRLGELTDCCPGHVDPRVTVEQLLRHTSGVPDYFDEETQDNYAALWRDFPNYRVRSSVDLLPLFAGKPMQYAPGERFKYNNSGYVLLGLVIEAVTGRPFDEYLQSAVFTPCGMERTGYYELDRLPSGCADSYIADGGSGGYRTNIYSVDVKGTGAGGAFTTVGDVRRFWDGLYGGTLVSPEALRAMTTPLDGVPYGMGFWLERRADGVTALRMEGCDPGVSFVSGREADGTVVTAVSNFGHDVWSVRRGILRSLGMKI